MDGDRASSLSQPVEGDPDIAGLTSDSREVKPGFLFAALAGHANRRRRASSPTPWRSGAVAVLTGDTEAAPTDLQRPANHLSSAQSAPHASPRMAARFYAPQPATVAAVTGTNGKTSVAAFTRQIWQRIGGRRAASLGTLGIVGPDFAEARQPHHARSGGAPPRLAAPGAGAASTMSRSRRRATGSTSSASTGSRSAPPPSPT